MTVNDTRLANGLDPDHSAGRTTPAAAAIDNATDLGLDAGAVSPGEKMAHMSVGLQSVTGPAAIADLALPSSMYRTIDLRFWLGAAVLGLAAWGLFFYLA